MSKSKKRKRGRDISGAEGVLLPEWTATSGEALLAVTGSGNGMEANAGTPIGPAAQPKAATDAHNTFLIQ